MIKKIFLPILLLLALTGCTQPFLSLDKNSFDFTVAGGTEMVLVSANNPWTAQSSAPWISIQYTDGSDLLYIRVAQNTETDARTGTVTVRSAELSETIRVSQDQMDASVLKDGAQSVVDEREQQLAVKLSANVDLTGSVKQGSDWCKILSTKAMTDRTVTLSLKANPNLTERRAVVVFGGGQAESTQVEIRQTGRLQTLAFTVKGVSTFPAPTLAAPDGFSFDGYLWVGQQQQNYTPGASIALNPAASTDLRIEGHNIATVTFDSVEGLTDVNFLGL